MSGDIIDTAQSFERTRPNGCVLELLSTPPPGCHVVRTFTDITERKANETVLRAARDQADRAASVKSELLANTSNTTRARRHIPTPCYHVRIDQSSG